MEKQPRVSLTLEAQVTGKSGLRTGIGIQGEPSISDLLAIATTFTAMLACEIEGAAEEQGVAFDALEVIRKVADWAPDVVNEYRAQNAKREDDGSEESTKTQDPETQE